MKSYDIEIIRKNIKNMHLRVLPDGKISVSAPRFVSEKSIRAFISSHEAWIDKHLEALPGGDEYFLFGRTYKKDISDEEIKALYRRELNEKAAVLIPLWEEKTGLKCSKWQIRDMKSRWGSCSVKSKSIRLALNLAKYPEECLEYVILHELSHIKIPNHSKEFKDFLASYMPDFREREKLLKGSPKK